jgi:hypothetical protein
MELLLQLSVMYLQVNTCLKTPLKTLIFTILCVHLCRIIAAHKFMVSSPKVIKQKAALQERKRKRDEKKVVSNKKKKKGSDLSLDKPDSDSDDEEPQLVTPITVYVLIPKKPLLTTIGSKSRSKASTVDDTLQKGPFTLLSTDDYQQFLSKLAITLPCQKPNIHQSKIQWKTKKPINAPYLLLGGEAGFSAMITETTFRKPADRVILLSMPPPAVPMEDENVRFIHQSSQVTDS